MSISKIELGLPFGFQPDPILETATPEQRAIVLTTGCVALKALLFKTDSLSNEEAYKKATAEQAEKWLAEKSELEKKALREKKELEDKKAAEVRQLNDKLIAEQKKIKRKEEELTEADTLRAKAEREAEILRKRESQTLIDERTRTRSQVESENSREIEKLTQELKETKSKIEETEKALREALKKVGDTALEAEKDKNAAVDKVREESTAKILALTSRQSNSSLKGQDNEKMFGELLHKVFGISADYVKQEHRIESGDHIIEWEGLKLMFENKYYEKQVTSDEVEKAIKDFKKHPECDVLIFVSEKSSIAKHQRPGHLDIDIVDGRAAIWIGEFNRNEDKVVYLQMIAQVIRQLANFQKRAKEIGDGDGVVEDYKSKILTIRRYFESTNEDLKSLVKAQFAYQRAQKVAWDALKEQINTFKGNFDRRLQSAMKDENDEIDYSSTVDDSQINTAEKKKRKAAAPKATPKGKRNCDGQIDKSPTNTTFQNDP
ncbi:uncharacterized protein LOC124205543 [Daphnia pulex]|uniref:uncharacterized protein LOC124205543 n=1 Tax=Daphnia pulex TaxID=6669 RepID=UPI001EDFE08A|nr:uncharacterized protein LOC124205543 [Daphnia pulex]XP_046458947.1 uncharacterized protein LOC124205543 [Daphnia pulex]